MTSTNAQPYYKPLTGLRFVAALMVFFSHFPIAALPVFIQDLMQQMQIGVPVFFVLSGFLICSRYFQTASYKKAWFKNYFINRFARIYPMFFLITLANILYKNEGLSIFLLNIFFLKGFFLDFIYTGVGQGWSITTEECFYFLAPLIFLLIKKRIPVLWQALACLAIGVLLVAVFKPLHWYGFFGSFNFMMVFTFFGRCFEFFTGVYLALYLKNKNLQRSGSSVHTFTGILGTGCIIILLAFVTHWKDRYSGNIAWLTIHNFISPVVIAVLLTGLMHENTVVSRLLSTPLAELLGKSSYTFYLVHVGVFHKLFISYVAENLLLLLLFITGLSIVFYWLIERPLNSLVKTWMGKQYQ